MPYKITCIYSWDSINNRHTFTGTATTTITAQEIQIRSYLDVLADNTVSLAIYDGPLGNTASTNELK